ncbi:MAG TPA: hypothetical protein VLZ83_01025 [Edaphocola sp.]|nr:hypothetical protein [Edaphocola sp.]
MQGKIITIEGSDGVGKSTQIRLLTQKLTSLAIPHKFIHFPMLNQGVYGKLIAEYLRGELGSIENVAPKLVALLFAEDRNEHKAQLNQWLDEGYFIIMDRYVYSNIAYQCAKTEGIDNKEILKQWILDFEFKHNKLPKTSLNFFLNVPFNFIKKNLSKIRKGKDRDYLNGKTDIHEDSLSLQETVLKEYQCLLKDQNDFLEIKCFSEEGEWLESSVIHEKIFIEVEKLLRG